MDRTIVKTSIVLLLINFYPSAFAGTGQLFSPAGLPQSSTQSYTPPTPGNTPTVTFPTPPLPLGEGALQTFPTSSLPLGNSNGQASTTTQTGVNNTQTASPQTAGSVQSFFQCGPVNTPIDNLSSRKTTAYARATACAQANTTKQKKSPVGCAGKAIWHILDNLGVPMFVSIDNDLDPSLRNAPIIPTSTVSTRTIAPLNPQKIPESELEGTEVIPKDDQQMPPLR